MGLLSTKCYQGGAAMNILGQQLCKGYFKRPR